MAIFALLWLVNPKAFKNRLQRKMNRRLKFIIYAFIMVFAALIIGSILKARGLAAKIAGLAGLIITIKIIMLTTSKSSEAISKWLAGKSLNFFRIWALIAMIMGAMLYLS